MELGRASLEGMEDEGSLVMVTQRVSEQQGGSHGLLRTRCFHSCAV